MQMVSNAMTRTRNDQHFCCVFSVHADFPLFFCTATVLWSHDGNLTLREVVQYVDHSRNRRMKTENLLAEN